MQQINWGIIGCGDVTEVKSGPAFNKVPHSKLVAVMRRDASKAQDYAKRHSVPKWYSNADNLINDAEINAVYIATPPSSHLEYAKAVLKAGKLVYVEKPMTLNFASANALEKLVNNNKGKLCVAHYRRAQPQFLKIKQLIDEGFIGKVSKVNLLYYRKPVEPAKMTIPKYAWRVNPEISGGGLFHDIAPHQIDFLYYIFGAVKMANGFATSSNHLYKAADKVVGNIEFNNGEIFKGEWNFNVSVTEQIDFCEIIGESGKIEFSFFDKQIVSIIKNGKEEMFRFDKIIHAQQPMIELVVKYFLGEGENPCSVYDGVEVMKIMDRFTS